MALLFAIEEINRNPHILPNISLGFDFYNVPYSEKNILVNALIWLSGMSNIYFNYNCLEERKTAAALTGPSWAKSAHIGTLLQLYKFPQLTVGPFDPILSNRDQFTSLYQMAPKGTSLSLAMVSLMLHFGWSWVGLLIPDDHRGTQFLADIREKMENNRVCIAFVETIQSTWNSFSYKYWKSLGMVTESLANIIIIYGHNDSLQGLMRNLGQQILTRKVWVMTSQWDVINIADFFLLDSFHGSLIFSQHHEQVIEFKNFIQTVNPYKYPEDNYLPKLWVLFFKCSFSEINCHLLENCQPNASLELLPRHIFDIAMNEDSYNTYNAVYTLAHSLHEMSLQQVQMQPFGNGKNMVFFPCQSVCSESCGPGFRKISQEGKAVCCYDCTPCADNEISNETDMVNCMKCPESHYANTKKKHCLQKTMTFLDHEDPLGMSLTIIALCFFVLTTVVLALFVKHRDTPLVKANNRTLSYMLLITLTVCFLCSLLFIRRPNTTTCILQQIVFGVAFNVALATVLAKAITEFIAFKVSFPRRVVRWLIISKAPNSVIPICTLVHLALCGIWLGTSPPFLYQDHHAEHGHIILVCNKGSDFAFHGVLGYRCFLALGSFTMAFMSRNLPDTFNEAKFLSFSMLVFFCVWLTFLPVYHSTKGKVMVAMEVFSILASSGALLGFIFVPKCYIILIRPDKNSIHHIRNRPHSDRKTPLKT